GESLRDGRAFQTATVHFARACDRYRRGAQPTRQVGSLASPGGGVAILRRIGKRGNREPLGHFGTDRNSRVAVGAGVPLPYTWFEVVTPEKYRLAGDLFDKLIGLPSARQQECLQADCGSDDELRQYVAGLLDAERKAPESFLARPAVQDAVDVIAERAASNSPLTGTRLGAYVIGRQIGAGGMGAVHEARDTRLDRKVAIKILPPAFAGDPNRVRLFRKEARAVSLLNHPNIVSI